MKSSLIIISTLVVLFLFTAGSGTALAAPRASEAAGAHYLLAAEDLHNFHLGGYYRYADRELNHGTHRLKQNKFMANLGMDMLPWLAVYGVLGVETLDIQPGVGSRDSAAEYGGGVWANLLDHDLLGNLLLESRIRVQALGQITGSRPDVQGKRISYVEYYSALTLSVINEIVGRKDYWPEALGLFVGPVYNKFSDNDLKLTGSSFGITTGLDIYFTQDTSLSLSYEHFDEDKVWNAAVSVRF